VREPLESYTRCARRTSRPRGASQLVQPASVRNTGVG
jgi:hypothetical protein